MLTLNQKQQQIWKGHLSRYIFDLSGFYGLLCIWLRTTPKFKQESDGSSSLFSHEFRRKRKQRHTPILSYGAAAHSDLARYVRTS